MEQIVLPEGYELIKDGNTYIVKEKKQGPPRSWEEFCERYPIRPEEACIDNCSTIDIDIAGGDEVDRDILDHKNVCVSKEEAQAFLALMQLRQLRKAWVGDWEPVAKKPFGAITTSVSNRVETCEFLNESKPLSFPTIEMTKNFFGYFRDLCETAKILL